MDWDSDTSGKMYKRSCTGWQCIKWFNAKSKVTEKRNNDQKNDGKKQDKDDKSGYDEKMEDDKKEEESNTGHDEDHETHEIVEIDNDTGETNNMADEKTNVRKSSRARKQRMIINDDEIGDCDDENDPDYIR